MSYTFNEKYHVVHGPILSPLEKEAMPQELNEQVETEDWPTLRRHRRVHMAHRRRVTILRRAARRQVRREHRALAQRGR